MLDVMEGLYGDAFSSIPAVYEDRTFTREQIQDAKLIGYTEEDHVVLQLLDKSITIVYSIDIDWLLYDAETDKVRDQTDVVPLCYNKTLPNERNIVPTYKIAGTQTINFIVDIEADTEEQALGLFDPYNDDDWYGVNMNIDYKIQNSN